MRGLEVRAFDPAATTADAWRRFHAYRRVRWLEEFPDDPVPADADTEAELRLERPLADVRRWLAWIDGEPAGLLHVFFRRAGTVDSEAHARYLDFAGGVPRARRRQGIGRALLAQMARFMEEHGKTLASTKSWSADADGFLARVGAERRWRNVDSRLRMDRVDAAELARLAAVADAEPALRWELHFGRVPWDVLPGLMEPFTRFINDQPLGTLDIPRMRYRLEGYASWYAEMDARGGEHVVVLLRAGDEVAAMSEASWDGRTPDRLYQKLTGVARPWRGRGLAAAAKARLLLLVRERLPQVRTVVTYNAQANAPMLAVNRRLGFEVYREESTWQLERAALADYLARSS